MFSLSYLDNSGQDGLGAQLLRYATLYSLARKFKIPWEHSDIHNVDRNPLDGASKGDNFESSLEELNSYLGRNASFRDRPTKKLKLDRVLSRRQLRFLLAIISLSAKFFKPRFSIAFKYPQSYVRYFPDLLSHFSNEFAFRETDSDDKYFVIQFHIRGALETNRNIPITNYEKLLAKLITILKDSNTQFRIVVHTDMPDANVSWELPVDNDSGTISYWNEMGIIRNGQYILLNGYNFVEWKQYSRDLEVIRDVVPLNAWRTISASDLFVGCNSTFSVMGALFSPNAIVLMPTQYCLLSDWIEFTYNQFEIDLDWNLFQEKMRVKINSLSSRRID